MQPHARRKLAPDRSVGGVEMIPKCAASKTRLFEFLRNFVIVRVAQTGGVALVPN